MKTLEVAQTNSGHPRCAICHQVSHGHHFGVCSCRACAAFFRRTVAKNKVYQCDGNKDCNIASNYRNMCRACRFVKCLQKGMNKNEVRANRDPLGKKVEPSTSTSATNAEHTPVLPVRQLLLLERLKNGCTQYVKWQRTLLAGENHTKLNCVTYPEYTRLEKTIIPYVLKLLKQFFDPFDKLDLTVKKTVFQNFYTKHQVTEILYQTYRNAASLPENAWQVYQGHMFDETDMDSVAGNTPIKAELIKSIETVVRIMKKVRLTMKQIEIDEMEKAAVTGLMLWHEVSNCLPIWKEAYTIQEAIMNELHVYVTGKKSRQSTGSRIGSIMCLINDIENVSRMFKEREMMEKIFDSRNTDIWDLLEF
uniref:Nuclear receptor domain-containing protein n=1 Tax=Panagrellus redivivus TaxID=6233 RepID=A0A7E4VJ92_PANRE